MTQLLSWTCSVSLSFGRKYSVVPSILSLINCLYLILKMGSTDSCGAWIYACYYCLQLLTYYKVNLKCKLMTKLEFPSTSSIFTVHYFAFRYVNTACNSLRLILKNFATVIKSNIDGPTQSVGVDISRQER